MDTGATFTGLDGETTYRVADTDDTPPLAAGGEKVILPIKNHPNAPQLCAAVWHKKPLSATESLKLRTMIFLGLPDFYFGPPLDLLHDAKGRVVGHTMNWRDGLQDLETWLNEHGDTWGLLERLTAMLAITNVLSALQGYTSPSFVPTDLKPQNLLIGPRGHPVILVDLNSLAVVGTGVRNPEQPDEIIEVVPGGPGTDGYRSPQRVMQPALTPGESDTAYELAVLMFEVLTGYHPCAMVGVGAKPATLDERALAGLYPMFLNDPELEMGGGRLPPYAVTRRSQGGELLEYCKTALLAAPHARPSVAEWKERLQSAINKFAPKPPPPPPPPPATVKEPISVTAQQPRGSTTPVAVFITVIVLLALMGFGGYGLWLLNKPPTPRELLPDPIPDAPAIFSKEFPR